MNDYVNKSDSSAKPVHMVDQSVAQIRNYVLNQYVKSTPRPQNAIDIFKGEWTSKLPTPYEDLEVGSTQLFEDPRISWAVEQFGGVNNKSILELGPLEGGHTYMLEHLGAESILSIEGNTRAYLKCLIIKEILGLKRAQFMCGDFIEYLRNADTKFDVAIASGVLYHMRNPVELIAMLSKVSDEMFIWTHYYDQEIISQNSLIPANKFGNCTISEYGGFKHELHRYEYDAALDWTGFCGGSDLFSNWMTREDILACVEHFGFSDIRINFDHPQHPNGPAFALSATRR
ncbi:MULTISPECIES: class I SAM-dependent methyltransferase [Methanoculleus]|nr:MULTISPECIES: class I SAM-dependent methyltransferase [Methanoculleus]UYU17603.1 class I SAM-dependent methyltransferase [Methanoculleus submarinus]